MKNKGQIPCFYKNCKYQYRRSKSFYTARSDRYISTDRRLGIFRSCKNHRDKWEKQGFNSQDTCEICHGLNRVNEEDVNIIYKGDFFILCSYCKCLVDTITDNSK